MDEGYIVKTPCNRLVIPGDVEYRKDEIEIFDDKNLKLIVNSKENTLMKKIVLVCLATEIRRGEALRLRYEDIDEKNNELKMRRTVSTVTEINKDCTRKVKTIVQVPKTKGSIRDIPLTKEMHGILLSVKSVNAQNKLKASESYCDDYKGYIFLTETGNLVECGNFTIP